MIWVCSLFGMSTRLKHERSRFDSGRTHLGVFMNEEEWKQASEKLPHVKALFTDEQIKSMNEFQQAGVMHPFTCGKCSNDLVATKEGWICPTEGCDYTQNWCHSFMSDGSWKKIFGNE